LNWRRFQGGVAAGTLPVPDFDYPPSLCQSFCISNRRRHPPPILKLERKTREATDFRGCDEVVEIGMGYFQTRAILSREPLGSDTAFATSSF
jgi:hypothetical protein